MGTINGTNGDDLIDESAETDKVKIKGKDGNDTLIGGSGDDDIDGGDGNDDITGNDGDDKLDGDKGDDTIDGGDGDDEIDGGKGDDLIAGGDGDDEIDGDKGDDTIEGGAGNDTIDGGKDTDTVVYSGSILDFSFTSASDDDDDDDDDDDGNEFDEFFVTDENTADGDQGTDLLEDVEILQFDDFTFDLTGGNNAPLVAAQPQSTGENSALGFAIPVYDFDGDTAVLTAFSITGGGTLTQTGAPTSIPSPLGAGLEFGFNFDPGTAYDYLAVGEEAVETVSVTFDDGQGGVTTKTFDLTITGENDAPTANDDTASTDEDTAIAIAGAALVANDIDPDASDVLSVQSTDAVSAQGATINDNGDGTFTYDPGTLFNGLAVGEAVTDTFTYTVTDGNGGTDTATVTVTIDGVNDTPTANDDTASTDEDSSVITGSVLLNDTDPDNSDVLNVQSADATSANGASVTNNGDGTFTYDPGTLFNSLAVGESVTDTFTYTVTDGNGGTDTATVTVTIDGENDTPTANDDTASTDEDTAIAIAGAALVANDTDPDASDVLSVQSTDAVSAQGATIADNGDGTFTYDPGTLFNSLAVGESVTDTFTYTVTDGNGGTDTATVTVTIDGVNDTPTANDDTASTDEDTAVTTGSVLLNDNDPDNSDVLSVLSADATSTKGATVTNNADGTFTYDPGTLFDGLAVGESDTDTFSYTVTDGNGGTDTATVTVTINGANDAPTANDDGGVGFTTDEDTFFTTGNALANDSDPDGDTLLVDGVDLTGTQGTVADNGNGSFEYDPNGQFDTLALGDTATDTFTYTVTDGNGGTDTATVTITIEGQNDTPFATVASVETTEDLEEAVIDLNTLVDDIDIGDILTISDVTLLPSGAVGSINVENGVVSFDTTPFDGLGVGESQSFQIQYTVTDDSGASNDSSVETLTVNINGLNDTPIAGNATGTADETTDPDTDFSIDLSTITSDPDTNDTLSYALLQVQGTVPDEGTAVSGDLQSLTVSGFSVGGSSYLPGASVLLPEGSLTVEGNGDYVFIPALNYAGPVPAIDLAATGAGSRIFTSAGGTETGVLDLAGGLDLTTFVVNGTTYNAGDTASFFGGSLTIEADGSFTLVPTNPGIGVVTPNVTLNAAGTSTLTLDEPDGQLRTIPADFTLVGGVLTIGAAQFGLDEGHVADFIVQYSATDDSGAANDTATGEITVTVTGDAGDAPPPTNAQPVAGDAVFEGDDETEINIDLLGLAEDGDPGDVLVVENVVIEAEGREDPIEFEVNASGELIIDPAQFGLADGEELTLTGSYTVNDGSGAFNATATGSIDIAIIGVPTPILNNQPVAQDDTLNVNEDALVTVDLRALVSDVDGDTLTISSIAFGDENGEVAADFTINETGTVYEVTFDPAQFGAADGETIAITLGYTVDDGTGAPNSTNNGAVTLNITGTTENAAPIAANQSFDYSAAATPAINLDLDDFVSDPDGDSVSVDFIELRVGGVPTATQPVLSGGNFVSNINFAQFSLGEDATETAVLYYEISDGNGGTDTGELTFNLTGNSAPTAAPDTVTYNLDTQTGNIVFDLNSLVGDVDPGDAGSLAITIEDFNFGGADGATPVMFSNSGGTITIDPSQFTVADGEELTATLNYLVDDGAGQFNSQAFNTVSVVISNPLDDPNITLDFEEFSFAGDSGGVSGSKGFVFGGGATVFETDELPLVGGGGRGDPPKVVEQGLLNGQTTDPGDNVLLVGTGDENQPFSINGIGATVTGLNDPRPLEDFGTPFDLQSVSLNGAYNDDMEITVTTYRAAGGPGTFVLVEVDSFVFTNIDASSAATVIDFTTFTGSYDDPLTSEVETYAFENIVKVEFEVTNPGVSAGVGGPGDEIVLDDVMIII